MTFTPRRTAAAVVAVLLLAGCTGGGGAGEPVAAGRCEVIPPAPSPTAAADPAPDASAPPPASPAPTSPPPDDGVDRVVYMTGFTETAREVYARVAAEECFFAEVGIEVQIELGRGGAYNFGQLIGGNVDFAVADLSNTFATYIDGTAGGQPVDGHDSFQVIGAIQQQWPMALLGFTETFTDDPDREPRPRDLNGKTIGLAAGTIAERLWGAYAAETPGVDVDTIEVVSTDAQQQNGLLVSGDLDAIALFSVSAPGLEAAGRADDRGPVTAFPWATAMPDLYGNGLLTSKRLAADDPDLVRRFTGALLRGLQFTLDNPERAAEILVEQYPENNAESAAEEIRLLKPFCDATLVGGQPLGYLDPDRVARALGLLTSLGEIEGGFNAHLPPPSAATEAQMADSLVNWNLVPGFEVDGS